MGPNILPTVTSSEIPRRPTCYLLMNGGCVQMHEVDALGWRNPCENHLRIPSARMVCKGLQVEFGKVCRWRARWWMQVGVGQ